MIQMRTRNQLNFSLVTKTWLAFSACTKQLVLIHRYTKMCFSIKKILFLACLLKLGVMLFLHMYVHIYAFCLERPSCSLGCLQIHQCSTIVMQFTLSIHKKNLSLVSQNLCLFFSVKSIEMLLVQCNNTFLPLFYLILFFHNTRSLVANCSNVLEHKTSS